MAAAGLFSLAHLPNPVLTPVTLVWGIAACVLFLRYRNIYTLGLAHGILGLCVAVIVPDSIQHHMRVGIGYYRYHPHRNQHRPDRIHRRVGDGRRTHPPLLTPRKAIEDARQSSQQNIAPIE